MNLTVINLAIQTVALLKSTHQETSDIPETGMVSQYFEKLGFNSEEAKKDYHHYRKHFLHSVCQAGTLIPAREISDDLCNEINTMLRYNEKVYLLLMVQDCLLALQDRQGFSELLNHIFNGIGIENSLIVRLREFLEQDDPETVNSPEYLLLAPYDSDQDESLEGRWIESNAPRQKENYSILQAEGFTSHILVMFVDQIKSYVIRCMTKSDQLFDQDNQQQCRFRLLEPGNELSLKGIPVLTYSDLKSRFLQLQEKRKLTMVVDHVQCLSKQMTREVNIFTTQETTGQLIGIVGNEGVGKSTLLKLLAGKLKPDSGSISINGYDLWKNKYLLKGTIGYVPEEDLLYEELTVSDNLGLTARLYYSGHSGKELDARVNSILSKLDLLELKHVVVGSVLSKHIQPGQRRMINIALELLREPQILLVDNALSGLGMADASKVIKILHDYSFAGNLVITTISQSDSNTFRFFDKIWILDEGGRAVYNGPVKNAPVYLSKHLKLAYQESREIDPSQLLDMVNYRLPDRVDNVWKRVKEPKEWHDLYLREQILKPNGKPPKSLLPARMLKIPNLEVQLLIFSIRNFKCKFSRLGDIIRALVTGPVVALLLSLAFRMHTGGEYLFSANDNLPLYQFLSVVVAIFLGLVLSAGEILKEKNMLEKEEYLEFSRFSYINSKILYLFPVIALQTFLYVLTGNLILDIRSLFWIYWLVLFSSACFGILLGLSLSASVKNSDVLYKRILPFVIALQLLLGGGLIPYNRLNVGNGRFTPVLGDLMVSRWGYEALAVRQYTGNPYQKMVYETDKRLSQASYYSLSVIPKLQESLMLCSRTGNEDSMAHYTGLLRNEILKINALTDVFPFEYLADLPKIKGNESLVQEAGDYLTYLSLHFYKEYEDLVLKKNRLLDSLDRTMGKEVVASMKNNYYNEALENTVTNKNYNVPYTVVGNEMIRNTDNIFQEPYSNLGRACLFCPVKQLNGQKTDTLWFNLSLMWLFTAACYLLVLFDAAVLFRIFRTAR
jgi:ABC transport system ATP-binding/permease protein